MTCGAHGEPPWSFVVELPPLSSKLMLLPLLPAGWDQDIRGKRIHILGCEVAVQKAIHEVGKAEAKGFRHGPIEGEASFQARWKR